MQVVSARTSIAPNIHLSMAMKFYVALGALFWTQAFRSFLAVCPGSWCIPALGQSRFALPHPAMFTDGLGLPHSHHVPEAFKFPASAGRCFGPSRPCDVSAGLGPVLAVSAGRYHTCAVRADGQLVCFGSSGASDVPAELGPVMARLSGR